jgi:hypothetical protein
MLLLRSDLFDEGLDLSSRPWKLLLAMSQCSVFSGDRITGRDEWMQPECRTST